MFKNGLVLEGGGLRGIFTSGVLDAFTEKGIKFPYVIGVSAGTCNGVSYIAGNLHRMRDIIIGYSSDERYMSLKSMIKNGEYVNTKWVFGELSYEMFPLNYEGYEGSNTKFCVVVTNAKTGKAEYLYPKDFRDGCPEIVASCAIPVAAKPVQLGRDFYFDGGLADSIPLQRAFEDGCEKCVVILTQDRSFKKQPIGHDKAVKRVIKKYPAVAERLLDRHNMYNSQRDFVFEQEKEGNAFVICPREPLHCSTFERDTDHLRQIYNLGYEQGLENIDKVKAFCEI
ncbi:MAG: patatin family protein [Eubacteriales bacterium]|nr:patatin family protein [Eubacteriales bacterium]